MHTPPNSNRDQMKDKGTGLKEVKQLCETMKTVTVLRDIERGLRRVEG